MTKKTLIILVLVFLGSFSLTYLLLKKDKTPLINIANHIPISNNGIVGAVNYSAIEGIVQTEMFRNPLALLDMKNEYEGNQFASDLLISLVQGGIDKDQKIIFSIADKIEEGSFLLFVVDDYNRIKKKLKERLVDYPQNKINFSEGTFGAYYTKENIEVVLDKNFLLIASGEEKEIATLWGSISLKANCYAENTAGIDSLLNNEHHISIWTDKTSLISSLSNTKRFYNEWLTHVDFLDGKLTVLATMLTDSTYFSKEEAHSYDIDSSALSFHLNMKNINEIPNTFNSAVNLQIDSIAQLFNINYAEVLELSNGEIDLNVLGKGIREDKIITYEFDDDFSKVKREKVITSPIVNFVMSIGDSNERLYKYLKENGVIKLNEGEEVFTNPIGKCYAQASNSELLLLSNKELSIEKSKIDSNGLYLFADFNKLNSLITKKSRMQLDMIQSLECIGNQKKSLVIININLSSKNPEKNILFDLITVTTSNPN